MRIGFFCALLSAALATSLLVAEDDKASAWIQENIDAGKYAEAVELAQKALRALPVETAERRQTALALIEALRIMGKVAQARDVCADLLKSNPKDTLAILLQAEIDCDIGNYQEAKAAYDKIIAEQPENERAWALRSITLRALGDSETLRKTADHFFYLYEKKKDYFNSDDVKDPLELAYIALGFQDADPKTAFETGFLMAESLVEQRRLRSPEIFLWSARLAREKYHFDFASQRYAIALQMRPRLPDALAGQAAIILQTQHKLNDVEKLLREALAVNPNHIEANLLLAAVKFEEDRYAEAKQFLDTALAVNPKHIEGLAMLSFYYLKQAQPDKTAEIEKRATMINPKSGDYYCKLGEMLETSYDFNNAAQYYQKAIELDSENWRGYYGLGMNTSRQGAHGEKRGKELLLQAFDKNRFNIWAANMIKALDKIIGDEEQQVPPVYLESKTERFTLKFYNKEAAIVRPYLEEWAERAYEEQTKKFQFKPEGPLTIELCASFQDQAARTVGLPNFGALGVCFGKLCTVVSPREGKGNHPPFNWRKVLEHEFGHVIVLQLSRFRVPRWYTEGFSTYLENNGRLDSDQMMANAIANEQLKDLDTMNDYFRGNAMMAYIHGRYVIEYLEQTFGFDAHLKIIKAFADGKKLADALTLATGKSMKELNDGQLAFTKKAFKYARLRHICDPPAMIQLELAARAKDAPAQALADYALAQLALRKLAAAEALANRALVKDAKCVDALNVLGVIAFEKKNYETAKQNFMSATALDSERSFEAWQRLGAIYKKEGRTTKAIEAFEAARNIYPRYTGPDNPHHELPDLYAELEPPQLDKALSVWRNAVSINPEDVEAAFKGLKLAAQLKAHQAVVEFAQIHIAIDPYNAETHQLAGKAYEELRNLSLASREYGVAVALDDKDVESLIALARVERALGNTKAALRAVERALEVDGSRADAEKLRDELRIKKLEVRRQKTEYRRR